MESGSSGLRGDDARVAVARPGRPHLPPWSRRRGVADLPDARGRRHDPDRRAACERHDPRDRVGAGRRLATRDLSRLTRCRRRRERIRSRPPAPSRSRPAPSGLAGAAQRQGPGGTGARGSRAEGHRHASPPVLGDAAAVVRRARSRASTGGHADLPNGGHVGGHSRPGTGIAPASTASGRERSLRPSARPIDSRRASISTMRQRSDACVPFPASARGRRLR